MLRWLVMLCLFGVAAWAQVPRNGSQQNQKAEHRDAEPNPAPPITQKSQSQEKATAEKQQPDPKSSRYQWSELLAPANIPNWCLVLVGGLAAGMAYWTLRIIERQTGAIEKNTTAFINKERARLFIRPSTDSENIGASFEVENLGQSPALVVYCFVGCELRRPNENLPSPPDYTAGDPEWVFERAAWVPKGKSEWVGHHIADYFSETENPDVYADILAGRDILWFYGVVRYEDIVSGDGEEIRFCYRCHAYPKGKSFLSEAGPAEYRGRRPYKPKKAN